MVLWPKAGLDASKNWAVSWTSTALMVRVVIFTCFLAAPFAALPLRVVTEPLVTFALVVAAATCAVIPRTVAPVVISVGYILTWTMQMEWGAGASSSLLRALGFGLLLYTAFSLIAVTTHTRRNTAIDREILLTWGRHVGFVAALTSAAAAILWASTTYVPLLPSNVAFVVSLVAVGIVIYVLARIVHKSINN
ncbi:hypothetical protein [Natronoglycomyces albus]|uniref:Uncharacterized protein n=1 Tax=Natronoglycomyces albus TaxID=2811108 RepID=A0A895XKU3_9ACTN|nr:hypothetical protein [Natronoglycomyces albus]QSB05944.1 hypothetical protein JQS30_03185 [Natronoglycomyces albus]